MAQLPLPCGKHLWVYLQFYWPCNNQIWQDSWPGKKKNKFWKLKLHKQVTIRVTIGKQIFAGDEKNKPHLSLEEIYKTYYILEYHILEYVHLPKCD